MERLHSLRPEAPLVPKLVESLVGKVQGIATFSASNLVTLTEVLKKNTLPQEYKDKLQSMFEERALNEKSSALKLQTLPQTLTAVYNYLSESEWNAVQSKGPSDTMPLIARRLKACGLKSLKEITKRHCVALVLHCMLQRGEVKPPSTELYKLVCYFLDTFHACTQPPLTGSLATYPTKPMDLGEEFVQKVYTREDGPANVNSGVPLSVSSLLSQIPVRSTNRQVDVKENAARTKEQVSSSDSTLPAAFKQCMEMMKMMMGKAKAMDSGEDIPIHMLPPKQKTAPETLHLRSPAALTSTAAVEVEGQQKQNNEAPKPESEGRDKTEIVPEQQDKPNKKRSLQALEDDMLVTLRERKKEKGNKVEPTKGMKRPAACKAAAKRHASKKSQEKVKKTNAPKAATKPWNPKLLTCFGCSRCRGDPYGCEKCARDSFRGQRLNGRSKWQAWWNAQKSKK